MLYIGQASGEFIHLTDSAKSSCKIDIEGNVKQTVTEQSANLLDLTKLTIVEKPNVEIDNISANEVTFHATNNTATSYYLRFKTVLKQGTYYLRKLYEMLEGTAVPGNNGSGVIFISKSDWSKEFVRLYADSEKGNFTLTEDTEVFITLILAKTENGKIRFYNLMLSNEDTEYVPFVPNSPSLDYPSEVETVKDSVKVTSCSANVLDLTTLTAVNTIECTTENKKENEITLTSTNKTGASYIRFKGKIKAGTWYVKKEFEVLSGTGTNYTGRVFIQDTNWNNVLVLNKNLKEGSFTLEEDKELYITLIAKETTDTSTEVIKIRFYNLMISKDDVDFVKHEQNSITVSIQQEMLTNDYLDKTNKKEIHNFRKIILDGTKNYTLLTTTENYLRFMLDLSKTADLKNGFKVYCENLKVVKQSTSTAVNEEKIIERDISLDKQLQIVILKSRLTEPTVEGLKQYLATNNIVAYCELEEATKLDLTQEQIEALEKLDEMQTYKNITNITTDSIAILDVDYKKDLETWQKQQDDRITALEELLNTTQTSAMLIENLENDLLKEVE